MKIEKVTSFNLTGPWEKRTDDFKRISYFNLKTNDCFFTVFRPSENRVRTKFLLLSAFQIPGSALRILARIIALISGDFIRSGITLAQREIKKDPSRIKIIAYLTCTLSELVKNIMKIVTLPLAAVGAELSAIYGIFKPLDGTYFYYSIEDRWSRNEIKPFFSKGFLFRLEHFFFRFTDYAAICLQPERIWKEKELYFWLPSYESHIALSKCNKCKEFIEYEKTKPSSNMLPLLEKFYSVLSILNVKYHLKFIHFLKEWENLNESFIPFFDQWYDLFVRFYTTKKISPKDECYFFESFGLILELKSKNKIPEDVLVNIFNFLTQLVKMEGVGDTNKQILILNNSILEAYISLCDNHRIEDIKPFTDDVKTLWRTINQTRKQNNFFEITFTMWNEILTKLNIQKCK